MSADKTKGKVWASVGAAVLAIVSATLTLEGGFVNDPADPGGATNHGVTEKVARANGYQGDMRELPKEAAQQIYVRQYVARPGFEGVVALSPALGEKIVDAGVNVGQARAARWFQEALNQLSRNGADYPKVVVDGQVGEQSLAAFRALKRKRGHAKACELMLKLMDIQQGAHYMRLGMPTFLVGWVDHRIGNVPPARCAESVQGATP